MKMLRIKEIKMELELHKRYKIEELINSKNESFKLINSKNITTGNTNINETFRKNDIILLKNIYVTIYIKIISTKYCTIQHITSENQV